MQLRHVMALRLIGHFAFCAAAALSCARGDSVAPDDLTSSAVNGDVRGSILLVGSVSSSAWSSDALAIENLAITGDTLRATISYGGGCRRHALQPIAETVWAESYPVQVAARIAHNALADPCKALVSRVLYIDLSPLKRLYQQSYQTASGRIAIRLAGAKETPVYDF